MTNPAFLLLLTVSVFLSVRLPQRIGRRQDPDAEVDGKPGVFVVVCVAVERRRVARQNVFQMAVRQVPAFGRRHRHQSVLARVYLGSSDFIMSPSSLAVDLTATATQPQQRYRQRDISH